MYQSKLPWKWLANKHPKINEWRGRLRFDWEVLQAYIYCYEMRSDRQRLGGDMYTIIYAGSHLFKETEWARSRRASAEWVLRSTIYLLLTKRILTFMYSFNSGNTRIQQYGPQMKLNLTISEQVPSYGTSNNTSSLSKENIHVQCLLSVKRNIYIHASSLLRWREKSTTYKNFRSCEGPVNSFFSLGQTI